MENRESYFLDYNIKNILTNLLQAEDHIRNLSSTNNEEGHNSCIIKHLLICSGEAGEGISHSSVVDKDKVKIFKEIKSDIDNLIKDINRLSTDDTLIKVREIRKKAESLNKKYDTSRCSACGCLNEALDKLAKSLNIGSIKDLNSNKQYYIIKIGGSKMVTTRDLALINGGQLIGKVVTDIIAPQIDTAMGLNGAPLYNKASTWINIGGGLALQLLALRMLKGNAQLAAAVIGSNMLSEIVPYAMQMAAPAPAAARVVRVAPPVPVRVTPPVAVGRVD